MNLIKPSFSTGYAKNASESANPNLWKGLVGAWMPSFGVTGNTLKDVSGNGNDGTLQFMDAATDWIVTSKGLALDFDGVNDKISLNKSPSDFTGHNNSATLACVFKADLTHQGGLIATDGSRFYIETINVGGFKVHWGFGGAQNSSTSQAFISSGEWYHYAATYNGSTAIGYLNGLQTDSSSIGLQAGSGSVYLGSFGSRLWFNGKIQSAAIYNRALSPSEIKQVYLNPAAPFQKKTTTVVSVPVAPPTTTAKAVVLKKPKPSYATEYARNASESANPNLWKGLVGAWMPSFGVTGGTLKDVSGNGNDGTLNNMDPASDWVATSKGLALDFDGVNDYVSIDAENLYPNLTQATWNFWVKFRSFAYSYNQIAETNPAPSTINYQLSCLVKSNGKLAFYAYGGAQSSYDGTGIHTLATNRWYNLTYVFKGSERQEGWVDGVYDGGSGSPVASLQDSTSDFRFSFSNFATRYINGIYGSVKLYNRALSPSEIKQLYLNPSAPFERKQQTVGLSTAAVVPSANFNPFSVLTHPLEQ